MLSKFSLSFFLSTYVHKKQMTIKVTEFVKWTWYKLTLLLGCINITSFMSWSSVFTSQITKISNFIRFINLLTKSKSTNIVFLYSFSSIFVIMMSVIVFLKKKAILFSNFTTSFLKQFAFLYPRGDL